MIYVVSSLKPIQYSLYDNMHDLNKIIQHQRCSITITFVIFVMYKLLVPVKTLLELQRDFKMVTC